jgi:hypothetical protein
MIMTVTMTVMAVILRVQPAHLLLQYSSVIPVNPRREVGPPHFSCRSCRQIRIRTSTSALLMSAKRQLPSSKAAQRRKGVRSFFMCICNKTTSEIGDDVILQTHVSSVSILHRANLLIQLPRRALRIGLPVLQNHGPHPHTSASQYILHSACSAQ